VPGPGVLNTTAALCTAYACNAPVLCLTGQIPSQSIGRGFGELHELPDQLATLRTLTKWATRVDTPEGAPASVAEAFRQLCAGRPRPVSIEMAPDIMAREAEVADARVCAIEPTAPDSDAIAAAAMSLPPPGVLWSTLEAALRTPLRDTGACGAVAGTGGVLPLRARHRQRRASLGPDAARRHRLWPSVDLVIGIGSRMMEPLQHWGRPAI